LSRFYLPRIWRPFTWLSFVAGGNLLLHALVAPRLGETLARTVLWALCGALIIAAAFYCEHCRVLQTVIRALGIWIYGDLMMDAVFDAHYEPYALESVASTLVIGVAYGFVAIWTRVVAKDKYDSPGI